VPSAAVTVPSSFAVTTCPAAALFESACDRAWCSRPPEDCADAAPLRPATNKCQTEREFPKRCKTHESLLCRKFWPLRPLLPLPSRLPEQTSANATGSFEIGCRRDDWRYCELSAGARQRKYQRGSASWIASPQAASEEALKGHHPIHFCKWPFAETVEKPTLCTFRRAGALFGFREKWDLWGREKFLLNRFLRPNSHQYAATRSSSRCMHSACTSWPQDAPPLPRTIAGSGTRSRARQKRGQHTPPPATNPCLSAEGFDEVAILRAGAPEHHVLRRAGPCITAWAASRRASVPGCACACACSGSAPLAPDLWHQLAGDGVGRAWSATA